MVNASYVIGVLLMIFIPKYYSVWLKGTVKRDPALKGHLKLKSAVVFVVYIALIAFFMYILPGYIHADTSPEPAMVEKSHS